MRVVCRRTHLTVLKFEEYFGGKHVVLFSLIANATCIFLKIYLYKHILFGVHLNFYMQIFNCKNFYSLHGVMINNVLASIKCGMS